MHQKDLWYSAIFQRRNYRVNSWNYDGRKTRCNLEIRSPLLVLRNRYRQFIFWVKETRRSTLRPWKGYLNIFFLYKRSNLLYLKPCLIHSHLLHTNFGVLNDKFYNEYPLLHFNNFLAYHYFWSDAPDASSIVRRKLSIRQANWDFHHFLGVRIWLVELYFQ